MQKPSFSNQFQLNSTVFPENQIEKKKGKRLCFIVYVKDATFFVKDATVFVRDVSLLQIRELRHNSALQRATVNTKLLYISSIQSYNNHTHITYISCDQCYTYTALSYTSIMLLSIFDFFCGCENRPAVHIMKRYTLYTLSNGAWAKALLLRALLRSKKIFI